MNKGIWILVLIVVIVVVYLIVKKKNSTKEIPNAVQNLVQNTIPHIISSGNSVNSGTTPVIKINGFNFGDNLYANQNEVNIYKTASASPSNLASYKGYSKDELIGTYLSTDGIYTKVLIQNPASSVYVLTNQIYSK